MSIASSSINLFPWLYGKVRWTGALNSRIARSLFVRLYFAYKWILEDSLAAFLKRNPQLIEHGHILDIGANIGYTSVLFSRYVHARHRVFAFEPDPTNMQILDSVILSKKLSHVIAPVAVAVGDKVGEVELWENKGHHADHRIVTDSMREKLLAETIRTVPMVSVDSWCASHCPADSIALIKIDVQGYEMPVIAGMKETLARNPRATVIFEYMPSMLQEMGFDAKAVLEFFARRQMKLYLIAAKGKLIPATDRILADRIAERGYVDLVATARDVDAR